MGNAMSFSVTPKELARVQVFKSLGIDLDPRQEADLITVIVITVVYFIQFLAVLFMLWNRKYPPIKAKNPVIMTLIFLASVFWYVGDLQINGHAPLRGTPLEECKGIGVWLHLLMGVCSVSLLIALRSYGLYQVFCHNRPFRGPSLYTSIGVIGGSLLVFGIITQILPGHMSVQYNRDVDMCGYDKGYKTGLFVFIWLTWVAVAALSWRVRNIKSSFNESRETTISGIIVFGVLTFMTVLTYVSPYFPTNLKVRIVATSLNHLAAMLTWWMIMAVTLYKCLTDREAYLKAWIFKLRQDGLQRAYHVDSGASPSQNHSVHMESGNKELGYANANGDFFYAAKDGVCADRANDEVSNLARSSQNSTTECIRSANPEVANVHWTQTPPSPPPQQAGRRPWNKLASAVSNIGSRPNFASSASPPARSSHLPASANAQLYTPIINFAEPATNTPQPPVFTPNSRPDNMYDVDGRQIL
ncbi:hypothetical protein IWW38_000588 [Coemansia aciculifera]|uniref:Uncharacterized protein n=1 Tax=Coemansia aciculifera TaxID=417176 RepID=A0ACC1MAE2_9FUNG|nr:hypothetical protein IWW38_000588 [Coemansia aciculifera]